MTKQRASLRNAGLIRSLYYFEAVARHLSLKLAAEEMGVSQSAVSHQIRDLTEALGEQLIVRSGRGIALTAAGRSLSEKLVDTFAGLQSSVEEIIGSGRSTLRLAVCSSFGPGWLIPRLSGFFTAHPQIDLQLRLYAQDPTLTDQVADAFVTAMPVRPGYAAVPIVDEMLVAVQGGAQKQVTVARRFLVTTEIEAGSLGQDWRDYCARADLRLSDLQTGTWLQCTHYVLALEMAKAGLGVALVPEFLARRDLDAGALSLLSDTRAPSGRRYHLCFKTARAQQPEIRALVHWIKGQALAKPPVRLVHGTGGAYGARSHD